jgi:hypothetical protein
MRLFQKNLRLSLDLSQHLRDFSPHDFLSLYSCHVWAAAKCEEWEIKSVWDMQQIT